VSQSWPKVEHQNQSPPPTSASAPSADDGRTARLGLTSLLVSLLGFLVVALVLYEFKFHGVTAYFDGAPTRIVFVLGILLAVAPFLLIIFRRVPLTFLALPVLLLVFLYPLFSPFGLPYDRDSVYVFQFARDLLVSGSWTPGSGVTEQGIVYSYYPGIAIFLAEAASLTSLPLTSTFSWSTDLFRLLVIPAAVYAMTSRLFSARVAPLAVLLYLVEPSIEMNIPTQQDFAVTFFILTIAVVAFLAVSASPDTWPLRLSVVMATSMVVVSHHVSTYLLLGVLGAFALFPRILWRQDPYPSARSLPVFLRTLAFGLFWAGVIALPVLQVQSIILSQNLAALVNPSPASTSIPGASFPLYETVLVILAIAAVVVIAVWTLVESKRRNDRSFVTMAILSVLLLAILSIPFISTGFSFLALREFEFVGIILAPVAAWWIMTRLVVGRGAASPGPALPSGAYLASGPAVRPGKSPPRRGWRAGVALGVVALLVIGGSLVPLSTRDQFSPVKDDLIDSPMFINQDSYAAAEWANLHLSLAHPLWGDELAYTVFGGFGGFHLVWDSYELFNGTGFAADAVSRLTVGSYVITDPHMTTYFAPPMFPGSGAYQPSAGLTLAEVDKFQNPSYFSVVYENPAFTIYVTTARPIAN
jgi:hypothetical protein